MNKTQMNLLDILCRKLIIFLCENCHPHVKLIITPTGYELVEGIVSSGKITNYIFD